MALYGFQIDSPLAHRAEAELKTCLAAAQAQGTLWLQAEVGEALVTCLTSTGTRSEEACLAGAASPACAGPLPLPP